MHKCTQCNTTKPLEDFYPHWSKRYKKYYYNWCKQCIKRIGKERYWANREKKIEYSKAYRKANTDRYRETLRKGKLKLRLSILQHYSKETPECNCCKEQEIKFLAVDHINGGGHKHLKELKVRGMNFYRWLKNNNYPEGFQILCHNCNMAKGFYGRCPHTIK